MTRRAATLEKIAAATEILRENWETTDRPMTLRQVFYQLVSRQVTHNTLGAYQSLSEWLVDERKAGRVPWDHMEDRTRRPRHVSMWKGLPDYREAVMASYRRNVWQDQPRYIEVWSEKDALSGIFEDVLEPYGVTLNIGRGYDGWSSLREAARRFRNREGSILYFGDWDPTGEDIFRSFRERLAFFECDPPPEIVTVALLREDIERYHLPPEMAKESDSRSYYFVARHGDQTVELDALPMAVLRARIAEAVEHRMDMAALERTRATERRDRNRLGRMFPAPTPTRRREP